MNSRFRIVVVSIVGLAAVLVAGYRFYLRDHLLVVDFLASFGDRANVEVFLEPDKAFLYSTSGGILPPPPPDLTDVEESAWEERQDRLSRQNYHRMVSGPIDISGDQHYLTQLLSRLEIEHPEIPYPLAHSADYLVRSIKGDCVVDLWIGLNTGTLEITICDGVDLEEIISLEADYQEVFESVLVPSSYIGNLSEAGHVNRELKKLFQPSGSGNDAPPRT